MVTGIDDAEWAGLGDVQDRAIRLSCSGAMLRRLRDGKKVLMVGPSLQH